MKKNPETCESCRFWSDMIARAGACTTNPRGDVEALCLNPTSRNYSEYTVESAACDVFEPGAPIDAR